MNVKTIFILAIALVWCVPAGILNAQAVNSIYSMYGIGLTVDNGIGVNKALGGAGIAFHSGRTINNLNPASYLGVPSNSYVAEIGAYGIMRTSKTNSSSQIDGDMNFSYFSAAFCINPSWASSFGIYPFSSVDYEVDSVGEINGELTTFEKTYTGTGGLSRATLGNSFRVFKGLSVGFNASYIFGLVIQMETALENESFVGYELNNERFSGSLYLDYGLQYTLTKPNWSFTLGTVYGAPKKLNTTDDKVLTYNGQESDLEATKESTLEIPQKIGIGIAVRRANAFRAGFDYEFNNWSHIRNSNEDIDMVNSNRFFFGAELLPSLYSNANWFRKLSYMIGAHYKTTYLEIDDTPIDSKGLTFGLGIPFGGGNIFNLSVEYGESGSLNNGLIKSSHWGGFVTISLHELFRKKF
jgi:hypothetical protein